MQNLNATAAKSTSVGTNNSTNRKASSGYNYSHRYDRDDSDDESEDDDDELEDEDLDEDCSENDAITPNKDTTWPDNQLSRRKPTNMTSDIEQIRTRFAEASQEDATENESGENTTGDDIIELPAITKRVENTPDIHYQNFAFDEDIDTDNLISDEEDDNESGFLSQI